MEDSGKVSDFISHFFNSPMAAVIGLLEPSINSHYPHNVFLFNVPLHRLIANPRKLHLK